jgi:predicted acyl esterase
MPRLLLSLTLSLLLVGCLAHAEKIPMSDGTLLTTDVHLPDGEGPWPVILVRSTYGRNPAMAGEYLERGYAVVIQDVRGMGESEGEKYVFHADGWRPGLTDGADTVNWVKAQTWCNGKIGTVGGSALGITQLLLAPTTDGVQAQYIEAAPGNFFEHGAYPGGVFRKNMFEGWLKAIGQPHLIAVYKGEPRDTAFWSFYDSDARAADVNAPALFVNGWYDIFAQGTLDSFEAREQQGGAGTRGKNLLIMKWSGHGNDVTTDYQLKANRTEDLQISEIRRAFLAYHLKGDTAALDAIPKVHYYVMGDDAPGAPGSEWRTADTWPPFPTVETPIYLGANGALYPNAPGAAATLSFTFDPADPYPTLGGANLLPNLPSGPFDQRKYSNTRKDLLKFATDPLPAPVEVTGRVKVRLHVSSDAPDTDFTAKLIDIFPDGREINVLDNIRRVKSRAGLDKVAPLLQGESDVVEIEIDLWSCAWIFNTGHRIALHISSSNYPRFEINPNTGDDFPGEGVTPQAARNSVHTGVATPSALILPVRQP